MRAVVICVLLVSLAIASEGEQRQPTFLGAVDGGGFLIPIAIFDGGVWWNRWPWEAESETIPKMPVPRSLASIPADWLPPGVRVPARWKALRGARSTIPFRALRPSRKPDDEIMDTFAIRTTYRGPSRWSEPVIAISGPGTLGGFVTPARAESQAILRQLAVRIAAIERTEIDRWKSEAGKNGATGDISLTRVFMVQTPARTDYVLNRPPGEEDFGLTKATPPIDGSAYYCLGGEKLFRIGSEQDCKMHLSTAGVIVVASGSTILSERISSSAYSEFCGDAAESTRLLATLTLNGRTSWIVDDRLEDGHDYALIDPKTWMPVELHAASAR